MITTLGHAAFHNRDAHEANAPARTESQERNYHQVLSEQYAEAWEVLIDTELRTNCPDLFH